MMRLVVTVVRMFDNVDDEDDDAYCIYYFLCNVYSAAGRTLFYAAPQTMNQNSVCDECKECCSKCRPTHMFYAINSKNRIISLVLYQQI